MERTLAQETTKKVNKKVRLCGWVERRRDHGKLVFIDLKDRSGVVQIVISSSTLIGSQENTSEVTAGPLRREATKAGMKPREHSRSGAKKNQENTPGVKLGTSEVSKLRISDVIEVEGKVRKRPKELINPKLPTGKVEVGVEKVKILAKSKDLPFDIHGDGHNIGEEVRLKYRYLDLRRPRLVKNLELRHRFENFVRSWLTDKGFIEVETPYISKATPEGSRDFLVPSRLRPGKFYALPQAPQQYKQLLMVAGLEKYFQIARVFRDEDPRADRAYGEYTQIDIEMSFTTQDEILSLAESLITETAEKAAGKKIYKKPFPRIPYKEAMKKYGADRFDLREKKDPNVLAFAWVVDFPLFEETETREISPSHNPFTAPKDEDVPLLDKDPMKVRSWQHDLVCNGYEVAGGAVRITDPKLQAKVFEVLGHSKEEIKEKFGHLLHAFEYGVPPHGGIAMSVERLMMVFADEKTTREVTAFPMTSGGQTSVMDAPSEVEPEQLKELGIKVVGKVGPDESFFQKIIRLLKENKVEYQLYEHEPVYTSVDAAKIRGTKLEQGAKALVALADKKPILVVISAAKKIDTKKFKKLFKVKDLRIATTEEVKQITGVEIGAVPPFGDLVDLETYVDQSLGKNREIAFNAGLHTKSIKMKYKDWLDLVKPKTGDFSSE